MRSPLPDSNFETDLLEMLDSMARPSPEGSPVFHCSIDDFGNCQRDGIQAYAAYVADKDSWNRFNGRWDVELKKFGLDYLHTSEFLGKFPLIGDKPKDDEDDYNILRGFLRVIREELINPGGFGVIIITECEGYNNLTKEEKKWIRPPDRNSFELMIGSVCLELAPQLGRHNPIAFEVDESDVSDSALMQLKTYIELKKQNDLYKKSLGAITFADDKMLRALQAADMLANLALKGWRRQKEEKVWPLSLRLAITKDEKTPPIARSYNEPTLRSMANARRERSLKQMLPSDVELK